MMRTHANKKNSLPFDVKLLIKLYVHVLKVYLAKCLLSRLLLVKRRVHIFNYFLTSMISLSSPPRLSPPLSLSLCAQVVNQYTWPSRVAETVSIHSVARFVPPPVGGNIFLEEGCTRTRGKAVRATLKRHFEGCEIANSFQDRLLSFSRSRSSISIYHTHPLSLSLVIPRNVDPLGRSLKDFTTS